MAHLFFEWAISARETTMRPRIYRIAQMAHLHLSIRMDHLGISYISEPLIYLCSFSVYSRPHGGPGAKMAHSKAKNKWTILGSDYFGSSRYRVSLLRPLETIYWNVLLFLNSEMNVARFQIK